MKSVTTFDNFPTFAENGSRNMNTESAKYQVGFVEADTFPAEWANYLFHGATKGVSDLNTAVQSIWQENINVITQSGQTPNPNSTNQLYTAIQTFINNAVLSANAQVLAQAKLDAHPVGSLYWSSDPTDPSILFGGTWTQIKDRFVLAVGDTYTNGARDGRAEIQLTESQLPKHKHWFTPDVSVNSASTEHSHTVSVGNVSGTGNTWKHGHRQLAYDGSRTGITNVYGGSTIASNCTADSSEYLWNTYYKDYSKPYIESTDLQHSHSASCGNMSDNATHSHTLTIKRKETESSGSQNSFSILPPYIVKYCWERTA